MRPMNPIGGTLLAIAGLCTGDARALNLCLDADFIDLRGEAVVIVANDIPLQEYRYRPRCATVSEGTTIVFRAIPNFGSHPLYGGVVSGGIATIDPDSPIGSITSGEEEQRTLVAWGEFPYFCDFHYSMGMMGSLRVVPELFRDGFDSGE